MYDVMHLSNGMIAVRSCSVFALVYGKVLCYRPISLLCISTMSEIFFYLNKNSFILLYADDIFLITSSVRPTALQNSYLSVKQN